jgi:predicted nucleic acid-binding protein
MLYQRDERHHQAKEISQELEKDRRKIPVITDYILDETLTLLQRRVGYKEAVKFSNLIFSGVLLPQGQRGCYLFGIWVIAWMGQRTG